MKTEYLGSMAIKPRFKKWSCVRKYF